PAGLQDVLVIDENRLGGFGPEVDRDTGGLDRAEMSTKHEIELARRSPLPLAANRAGKFTFLNEPRQLVSIHSRGIESEALLDECIGPVPASAVPAIHEQIKELGDVAGRFPHLGMEDDASIDADDIGPLPDEEVPP